MVKIDWVGQLDKAEHLETIMVAGRRIHEAFDAIDVLVSAHLGVHRSDLRCLHLLEAGPATPGEVAAKTGLTSGSVTALIDRLESAGYVERRRSCADRRSVEIAMSAEKLAAMQALYDQIGVAVRRFFADRPVSEVAETGKALGVFAEMLDTFAATFGQDDSFRSPPE